MNDKEMKLARLTMEAIDIINAIAIEERNAWSRYKIAKSGWDIVEKLRELVME